MDRITVIPSFAAAQTLDDLKRILTRAWSEMANLVNNCFTLYVQSTMPTIPNNTTSLWQDTTNTPNEYYLVSNFGGTHQLIQLTAALPVDPLHKHSKLWASDGDPLGLSADTAGVFTFVSIPVGPASNPTADNQLARKAYVDTFAVTHQKARAYRNAAQNLTSADYTKIGLDTDAYDPANITDLTNNRIKPTIAGYYQVNGQVTISDLSPTDYASILLKKTGNTVAYGTLDVNSTVGDRGSNLMVADILSFDGANDYVELWVYASAAVALSVGNTGYNFLSLVGPF